MKQTANYGLKKIEINDAPADITVDSGNLDIIDTELKKAENHRNNSGIHVTSTDKATWNGKASGNHNHNSTYAPISHSNNGNIHITSDERNAWNGKASGSHNHSASNITSGTLPVGRGGTGATSAAAARSMLGAAPSGYGVGEELLLSARILDPLDISLKSGFYGFWGGDQGAVNSPNGNMVFACQVFAGDGMWRSVILVEINGSGRIWKNNYHNNSGWAGWRELGTAKATYAAQWINAGSGTYTFQLGAYYGSLIISTGITTGTNSVTNKALVMSPSEASDQWLDLVRTNSASIQVAFKGTYLLVRASNLSESAYISWAALGA